ncbi:transcriptional regulator [Kaistella haifensis DSM 19056]|uniref:Transcriptional regulator n=1 Tax=Kaistella haifensis DSM 19056 TaxID=1450526 RepID=A0A2D0A5Z6_9FLAO|nr:helix-turn-helix transcriptional regulator [Kaistella haifensis]OWK97043.1 transcriptional regulator [Kaistella haifensis DSM 19056]
MLFTSLSKAQKNIIQNIRERRLQMDLTQEGLAERSGVPLSTLRKFEQTGMISLESFLKILSIVGGLQEMIEGLKPNTPAFKSIDEVIKIDEKTIKKRGSKK